LIIAIIFISILPAIIEILRAKLGSKQYQIVDHKIIVMHFSHSGYKWSKSADDRHKAGENNRFIGGAIWVVLFCYAGYFFGDLPFVQENLKLLIIANNSNAFFPFRL